MNEKLLKEYVQEVMQEGGSWGSLAALLDPTRKEVEAQQLIKNVKKFWKKLTGFANPNSTADEFSEEWIENRELYDDMEFSDELKEKIKQFTRNKMPLIVVKVKGDMNKMQRYMTRSLDTKFASEVTALRKAAAQRVKDDEADID